MPDDWKIDKESAESVKADITGKPELIKKWGSFEIDVTANPFFNPTPHRIVKLKDSTSYPEKTYRYRKDPLRVVYYPERSDKTIYPLAAGSADDIAYKKRSKR